MPPSRLNAPVLTLDAAKMHKIDPRNVDSLFGMWTVFSKCSQSIKDGARLENMSWRVWARETLCCPPQPDKTIVPTIDIPLPRSSEVPSLSNSLDSNHSDSSEESQESKNSSDSESDSALSKSRGQEKHLTPLALEKIVVTIQEKTDLGPLSPSLEASLPLLSPPEPPKDPESPSQEDGDHMVTDRDLHDSTDSCFSAITATTNATSIREVEHRGSDTSVSSDGLIRSGSVVHGFSPISASFRLRAGNTLPPPSSKLNSKPQIPAKAGMFTLGGSSEDDDSSFEQRLISSKPPPTKSSLSQSLSKPNLNNGLQQKITSFRDIVEARRISEDAENDEGAIESSDEDEDEDDNGDSAIDEDDEDDGDWEDSISDDGRLQAHETHLFRRVDSRPELVSRPSMLTTRLNQEDRERALINQASRSTPALRQQRGSSANGPSLPESPPDDNDDEGGLMMRGAQSRPRPIIVPAPNSHAMAHSPRTTRRNMLSTELTESLRKNLLWERQQKSQTVNAFLKRSRNAQSMANLPAQALAPPLPQPQQHVPFMPPIVQREPSKNNSWNHYLDTPWEYHSKGW